MDTDRVLEKLDELQNYIEENSISTEERQQLYSRIAAHEKFINGNGELGAKSRLLILEKDRDDMKKALENLPASIRKEVNETIDSALNKTAVKLFKYIGIPLLLSVIGWIANLIYNAIIYFQ